MAIYRPPKPRWPLAVGAFVLGLIVGGLGALLLQQDPDPATVAGEVNGELSAAAASLEVVGIEYDESVEGGEVVKEAELRGAVSALESSRARYEDVAEAVEALAPERAAAIEAAYEEAEGMVEERADPESLSEILDELRLLLRDE